MLIIAGHVTVRPDQRDDYLAAFADLVRRARRAPGCLDVAVTADVLDPGRVYVYERWESWTHLSAWREVASAPDVDIEVTDADIAMWDAEGQRSPFDQAPRSRAVDDHPASDPTHHSPVRRSTTTNAHPADAPPVVDVAAWQAARDSLMAREKAHMREGDAIAAASPSAPDGGGRRPR